MRILFLAFLSGVPKITYHVRFFGDKGKRAWVLENKMMPYNNKDDLELLLKKSKQEVSFLLRNANKYAAECQTVIPKMHLHAGCYARNLIFGTKSLLE